MTEPAAKRDVAVVLASSRCRRDGAAGDTGYPRRFSLLQIWQQYFKRMIIDDFLLDRVFQPIGDWTHQRFGIHPQTIAEFFGVGAILAEMVHQVLLHRDVWKSSPIGVFVSCLAVGIPALWYWVIKKPIRRVGGRNPKRYRFAYARMIYVLFTLLGIAEVGIIKHDMLAHALSLASMTCIWLGLAFASLDEPSPRKQRRSVWGWAS